MGSTLNRADVSNGNVIMFWVCWSRAAYTLHFTSTVLAGVNADEPVDQLSSNKQKAWESILSSMPRLAEMQDMLLASNVTNSGSSPTNVPADRVLNIHGLALSLCARVLLS